MSLPGNIHSVNPRNNKNVLCELLESERASTSQRLFQADVHVYLNSLPWVFIPARITRKQYSQCLELILQSKGRLDLHATQVCKQASEGLGWLFK